MLPVRCIYLSACISKYKGDEEEAAAKKQHNTHTQKLQNHIEACSQYNLSMIFDIEKYHPNISAVWFFEIEFHKFVYRHHIAVPHNNTHTHTSYILHFAHNCFVSHITRFHLSVSLSLRFGIAVDLCARYICVEGEKKERNEIKIKINCDITYHNQIYTKLKCVIAFAACLVPFSFMHFFLLHRNVAAALTAAKIVRYFDSAIEIERKQKKNYQLHSHTQYYILAAVSFRELSLLFIKSVIY